MGLKLRNPGSNTGKFRVRSTESFLVNLGKGQIHLKIESVQYSERILFLRIWANSRREITAM